MEPTETGEQLQGPLHHFNQLQLSTHLSLFVHVPEIDTHYQVGNDEIATEEHNAANKRTMQNITNFGARWGSSRCHLIERLSYVEKDEAYRCQAKIELKGCVEGGE